MDDEEFDQALIATAFRLAADKGWPRVTVLDAARGAGLPLERARARFPSREAILLRWGRHADQEALAEAPSEGPVRDRLFDLLMRRIDSMQAHRGGLIMLLVALPAEPPTALLLGCATHRSMRWMLEAAGVRTDGLRGVLAVRGLTAAWLWAVRAWERDESADLSGTMAALDAALRRAEQAASWLNWTDASSRKRNLASAPVPPGESPGESPGEFSRESPGGSSGASGPPAAGRTRPRSRRGGGETPRSEASGPSAQLPQD
jgi:AcrR family transcriptional regulator